MQTKGILLNYEGTIDTNGQHWGAILWHKFQKHVTDLDKSLFNKAYVHSERALNAHSPAKPTEVFFDTLIEKITHQFDFLSQNGYSMDYALVETIAKDCNDLAIRTLRKTKSILESLSNTFPIVLVSNFYGNLNSVLSEFGINQYFADVVESGTSTTHFNTEIYKRGVSRLGYAPEECVAIGNSYNRDILPSKTVGCKTIWLNVMGWEEWGVDELEISDAEIGDFNQLPGLLERWQTRKSINSNLV